MLPARKGVLLTNSWGLCKDWYKSISNEKKKKQKQSGSCSRKKKIKDKRRKIDLKDEKETHK